MATLTALEQIADPPDVLRRFVETPFMRVARSGRVRSNDKTLAIGISELLDRNYPNAREFDWVVIRDADLSDDMADAVVLETDESVIFAFGRGAVFGVDRDRAEVLGFVSAGIPLVALREVIIPAMMQALRRKE